MKVVIFDVDGVLIDSNSRFKACLEEVGLKDLSEAKGLRRRLFWECFLSERYIHLDRIREEMVRLAKEYIARGYKVVVVTGRPETMREVTMTQLRNAGLEGVEVYFRRRGDYRSDEEYKVDVIRRLTEKYEVEIVYDDSSDVVNALRRELPEVKIVLVV